MLRWQAKAAKARLTDNTTGPDSIRPKEEKWKKGWEGGFRRGGGGDLFIIGEFQGQWHG